jgi:ATP-dependent Clp protease protease subunit
MEITDKHVARVRLQGAFIQETFRSFEVAKGILCVLGQLKGNHKNSATAYHFDSGQFSLKDCRNWLAKNNIRYMRIESAPILEDVRDLISNPLPHTKGVFELFIRGVIGFDVSGIAIAEEIDRLNSEGAVRIIERINSAGGDVIDGFNIVSANLRSTATIETINEGVAASMGAVILATGDVRRAYDFSTALIHDPMIGVKKLDELEDENQRANLTKIKDSLVKILKDATGQPDSIIAELMARETVMSATEQRQFGLVNNVIKSRVKKAPANLSLLEVMNYAEAATAIPLDKYDTQIVKHENMDKLCNFLELQNDANETSIVSAVEAISNEAKTMRDTLKTTQDELAAAKVDLKAANDKLGITHAANIKLAVDAAIDCGKFPEENRDTLTTQATENLAMFNTMVGTIPAPHASVLEQIQSAAFAGENSFKNEKGETVKKDWDWYQKNDPAALQNLEHTNKTEFDRLYTAYWDETIPVK